MWFPGDLIKDRKKVIKLKTTAQFSLRGNIKLKVVTCKKIREEKLGEKSQLQLKNC